MENVVKSGVMFQLSLLLLSLASTAAASSKPNIVFFLWDDQGYGDVSYIAPTDVRTPLLDSLAKRGRVLERHYTAWLCTPTRGAIMSGRNPINLGIQHDVFQPNTNECLSDDLVLWPEVLKANGYKTHQVGKWHLGYASWKCTPCSRGFDTAVGYFSGSEDYLTHLEGSYYDFYECKGGETEDLREMTELYGTYANYVYANKAMSIIDDHDPSDPLLLYITQQSVHSPYYAPSEYYSSNCTTTSARCTMQAMLNAGEDVMKKVIGRLQEKGLWENTIMIYASDNGAPSSSYHSNGILSGSKNTLWEGGVRTPSFVYSPSPSLIPAGTSTSCLFHVSDWYPTLIALSGGWENYYTATGTLPTEGIDGIDQSTQLLSASTTCQRNEVFLNVDPVKRVGGYIRGHMKLLVGEQDDNTASCDTGKYYPLNEQSMDYSILQLFNITADPGETIELSSVYPDLMEDMLVALQKFSYEGNPLLCQFPSVDGSYPSDDVPFVVPWEFGDSDVWAM